MAIATRSSGPHFELCSRCLAYTVGLPCTFIPPPPTKTLILPAPPPPSLLLLRFFFYL